MYFIEYPDFSPIKNLFFSKIDFPRELKISEQDVRRLAVNFQKIESAPKFLHKSLLFLPQNYALLVPRYKKCFLQTDYDELDKHLKSKNKLVCLFELGCFLRDHFLQNFDSRYLFLSAAIFLSIYQVLKDSFEVLVRKNSKDQMLLPLLARLLFLCHKLFPDTGGELEEDILDQNSFSKLPMFSDFEVTMPSLELSGFIYPKFKGAIYAKVQEQKAKQKDKIVKMILSHKELPFELVSLIDQYCGSCFGSAKNLGMYSRRADFFISFFNHFFKTKLVFVDTIP